MDGLILQNGSVSLQIGGGLLNQGTTTLRNCMIRNCSTQSNGGGVASYFGQKLTLIGCTVYGNSAGSDGGGIYADDSLTLVNCTVNSNTSPTNGGGIYSTNSAVSIASSTIAYNDAQQGGGFYWSGGGSQSTITNSIIAENTATLFGNNILRFGSDFITSGGYNLIGIDILNSMNTAPTDLDGGSGPAIDPLFGPLRNNGGKTWTHLISNQSPAFNVGDPSLTGTDQRGFPRAAFGQPDMGAVESNQVMVTNTLDVGTGSLRDAVSLGNADSDFTLISFTDSLNGQTITLTSGEVAISSPLEINAANLDSLIIDGNANDRLFHIHPGQTVMMDNLTLQNGKSTSVIGGGGLWNQGNATLENCTIRYCEAELSDGGGIANFYAQALILTNCIIHDNIAANYGGGIYSDNSDSMVVTNSLIIDNSAPYSSGGGIYTESNATLVDCVVEGNHSGYDGGGISFSFCNSAVIVNSIIRNNTSNNSGGGIYSLADSNFTVSGSTIEGNSADEGGGVYLRSNMAMMDCMVNNNHANTSGGGVMASDIGEAEMVNSTITNNHSDGFGGGITVDIGGVKIINSTIDSNHADMGAGGIVLSNGQALSLIHI